MNELSNLVSVDSKLELMVISQLIFTNWEPFDDIVSSRSLFYNAESKLQTACNIIGGAKADISRVDHIKGFDFISENSNEENFAKSM